MGKVNLQGKEVYMDTYLTMKLNNVKEILKKNWDCLIIIDGKERVGKSTLGITIGTYLYPEMTVNNIASDGKEAIKKLESLPDKSLLVIDEGSLIFSSKDSMRTEQRRIIKILNVIGQKNMILIIVLPSFFDLNKYIATDRARFLIHCYSDKKLTRGRFCYFSTNKLKRLYDYGKKNFGSYRIPRSSFVGKFIDYEPSWYDEYIALKMASLNAAMHEEPKVVGMVSYLRDFNKKLAERLGNCERPLDTFQKSFVLDVTERTTQKYLKEMRETRV